MDQLGPLALVSPLVKANSSHLAELVELLVTPYVYKWVSGQHALEDYGAAVPPDARGLRALPTQTNQQGVRTDNLFASRPRLGLQYLDILRLILHGAIDGQPNRSVGSQFI